MPLTTNKAGSITSPHPSPPLPLHDTNPAQWFEDLGGFEEASNIPIFVEWAIKAVQLFGARITYWATFNEPTVCVWTLLAPKPCVLPDSDSCACDAAVYIVWLCFWTSFWVLLGLDVGAGHPGRGGGGYTLRALVKLPRHRHV